MSRFLRPTTPHNVMQMQFASWVKEGMVYGERKLMHDHADEQPFTRDVYGVKIPKGVRVVVVQARDQQFGYGGKTIEVTLPGR